MKRVSGVVGMLILTVILVGMVSTQASGWYKTFGGTDYDVGRSVRQTTDGGYIISGYTMSYGAGSLDVWLIKTDSLGNEQWNKTFGGANEDYGASVRQTTDGGYIIAGWTGSYGAGSLDFWLIKTDNLGNEQWNKTFGGAGSDHGWSVQQTTDGGYIIAGYTRSFHPDEDAWLIKTDSLGNEQWSKIFAGGNYDGAYSVQQTTDGGYIVAGYTCSFGTAWGIKDAWLIKTDSLGNELWSKTFGGALPDDAMSVQQTTDGGYIIAGTTLSYAGGFSDVWLIKTDSLGNEQWNKTFGGAGANLGYSVQQTIGGGYVIAAVNEADDAWLIKTDSLGNEQWNQSFGGINYEAALSVQQTNDGGYIISGLTQRSFSDMDVYLIKYEKVHYIPDDFGTIQEALDAAAPCETIVVRDGTYTGAGNKDLDFGGKAITLRSENGPDNCIIDCENSGRGFQFLNGETAASTVDGFTIMNGNETNGGGIYCYYASPTIINCTISGNTADSFGGGIYCYRVSPSISTCVISGNTASRGGGICCSQSSPGIINCVISGNSGTPAGGGLFVIGSDSEAEISNCTISDNSAAGGGGAIYNVDSKPTIANSIVWGSVADEGVKEITITYSDVQGGYEGTGNIDANPLFVDPGAEDYHLQPCSPAIDAGDPLSDYSNEPEPNGGRINMGAYGNTLEATTSARKGDVDGSGYVDYTDLFDFVFGWHLTCADASYCLIQDYNDDCYIDYADLFDFVFDWHTGAHLTSPDGGEMCCGTQEVTWEAGAQTGEALLMDLSISTDGGASWQEFAVDEVDDGSYMWDTTGCPDSGQCKVKIVAHNFTETYVDESDSLFIIDNSGGGTFGAGALQGESSIEPAASKASALNIKTKVIKSSRQGTQLEVLVEVKKVEDLHNISFDLQFDPKVVKVVECKEGGFLNQAGVTVFLPDIDNEAGKANIATAILGRDKGATGSGTIARFTAIMKKPKTSRQPFRLNNIVLQDSQGKEIP